MKFTDAKGNTGQVFHAVFDGAKQLTAWRTCKVATFGALHRSSHRAKGKKRVRERNYAGLTIQSKVFVTPPRETERAAA
jgi:hypothetical protein